MIMINDDDDDGDDGNGIGNGSNNNRNNNSNQNKKSQPFVRPATEYLKMCRVRVILFMLGPVQMILDWMR